MIRRILMALCGVPFVAGCSTPRSLPSDAGASEAPSDAGAPEEELGGGDHRLKSAIVCPVPGSCVGPGVKVVNLATPDAAGGPILQLLDIDGSAVWIADAGVRPGSVPIDSGTKGQLPAQRIVGCDAGEVWIYGDGGGPSHVRCGFVGAGSVTTVTGTSPIVSSGGTAPAISLKGIDGGGLYAYAADGGWRPVANAGIVPAATTTSLGTIKLAGDFAATSTATVPVIAQLQAGEVTVGASTGTFTCASGATGCGIVYATTSSLGAASPALLQGQNTTGSGATGGTATVQGGSANTGPGLGGSVRLIPGTATGSGGLSGSIQLYGDTNADLLLTLGGNGTWSCSTANTGCGMSVVSSGTSGTAGGVSLTGSTNLGSGAGGPISLTGGGAVGPGACGAITVTGGAATTGSGTQTGGALAFAGGAATATSGTGTGGAASFFGGAGANVGGNFSAGGGVGAAGGSATVQGGTSNGNGIGGNASLVAGGSDGSHNGANAIVTAGAADTAGQSGGAVNISAGNNTVAGGTSTGGAVNISAGGANATSGNGTGGAVFINGGLGAQTGGDVFVLGGGGGTTNGIVHLGPGAADAVRINAATGSETTGEVDVLGGGNILVGSTSAAVSSGTNQVVWQHGTAPSSCSKDACAYGISGSGLGVMDSSAHLTTIGNGIQCDSTQTSCGITQASSTTTGTASGLAITGMSSTGLAGTGANVTIAGGNDSTTGGSGGNVILNAPPGGAGGTPGEIILKMNSVTTLRLIPTTSGTATNELDLNNGNNLVIGESSATTTNGTNDLLWHAGTAPTSCDTDACAYAVSSGGLSVMSGHGYITQVAPDVSGTVSSQAISHTRKVCTARKTGVSQTTTCTLAQAAVTGAYIDAVCIARTITAGTAGAIGDTNAIREQGIVATPASNTTALVGSASALMAVNGSANGAVSTCVISGGTNLVTVTLTGTSNGSGFVYDTEIMIDAYND